MNDEFDDIMGLGGNKSPPQQAEAVVGEPKRLKIIIDEVEGQPNYEVVGVNGVIYQIQRGLETLVPEAVVHVLKNAIATKYVKVTRADGLQDLQKRNLSSIPWRLVG